MVRVSLLIIFCFAFLGSPAQKVRFRDLAPALDTVSESQQISLLWEYITEDPNHGNANYRLAMLHYDIFRKSDPLLEYRKAMAHAKEASLRLLRARLLVTSQDVRSDNEYYAPLFHSFDSKGKPYVEFPVVQQKMNNAADSAQKFLDKMPAIFSTFTKSVVQYDKAVKLFAKLNTNYNTLEDIYMFYGPEMDKELEQIKEAYDSSVFYFNKYRSLITDFPLGKYNQSLKIRDIRVYRIDGLMTRFSFLSPEIEIWNYSQWTQEIREKIRQEIAGVKDKIEKNEIRLTELTKQLESPDAAPALHTLNKDLIFQLNNYDKNSLALALLVYKTHKQNWLLKLKSVQRDTAIDAKLELYSNLIQLNRVSDTLVNSLTSTVNDHNIRKHQGFLEKYYGGANGLQQFIGTEKKWIDNTLSQYQDILKTNLLAYTTSTDAPGKFIRIRNFNVPLFIEKKPVDSLQNSGILTMKVSRNPDGSMYVAGVHKLNKKTNYNLVAFVARLNPDGKAAWINELNFTPDSLGTPDANNVIGDMVTTKEGCALVVTSESQNKESIANTFLFISDKGEMKSFKLHETQLCRKILYQEANSSFVILFKGDEDKQQYQTQENVYLTSVNVLGDVLWQLSIPLKGIVKELVPVRDGYILTGNFTMLKNMKGEEIRTNEAAGQSNPFLIKISLQGNLLKVQPIISDKSIYIDKVVKVNDSSINLLGYESTFGLMEKGSGSNGNVMHMMTTFELQRICANF
jgi:hypothetical protein